MFEFIFCLNASNIFSLFFHLFLLIPFVNQISETLSFCFKHRLLHQRHSLPFSYHCTKEILSSWILKVKTILLTAFFVFTLTLWNIQKHSDEIPWELTMLFIRSENLMNNILLLIVFLCNHSLFIVYAERDFAVRKL